MTEFYLIAHKVRGEPAFDIAIKMHVEALEEDWWIIPTSGHRAYPYWSEGLLHIMTMSEVPPMPTDLPDHYEVSAAPKGSGQGTNGRDLLERLGLVQPVEPMTRRSF